MRLAKVTPVAPIRGSNSDTLISSKKFWGERSDDPSRAQLNHGLVNDAEGLGNCAKRHLQCGNNLRVCGLAHQQLPALPLKQQNFVTAIDQTVRDINGRDGFRQRAGRDGKHPRTKAWYWQGPLRRS